MIKKILPILLSVPYFLQAIDTVPNIKETDPALVLVNESKRLDHLLFITEKNLSNQKNLQKLFKDFQSKQLAYLKNSHDKEATIQMVKAAHSLLESIKEYHLEFLFDAEFISQLNFFSQFA